MVLGQKSTPRPPILLALNRLALDYSNEEDSFSCMVIALLVVIQVEDRFPGIG